MASRRRCAQLSLPPCARVVIWLDPTDSELTTSQLAASRRSASTARRERRRPVATKPAPSWPPPSPPADRRPRPRRRCRAAPAGRKLIIDEGAAKLDLPGASADYKKLFALYQGLGTLHGPGGPGRRSRRHQPQQRQKASISSTFAKGWFDQIASCPQQDGQARHGARRRPARSPPRPRPPLQVPKPTTSYQTPPLTSSTSDRRVPAFEGRRAIRHIDQADKHDC